MDREGPMVDRILLNESLVNEQIRSSSKRKRQQQHKSPSARSAPVQPFSPSYSISSPLSMSILSSSSREVPLFNDMSLETERQETERLWRSTCKSLKDESSTLRKELETSNARIASLRKELAAEKRITSELRQRVNHVHELEEERYAVKQHIFSAERTVTEKITGVKEEIAQIRRERDDFEVRLEVTQQELKELRSVHAAVTQELKVCQQENLRSVRRREEEVRSGSVSPRRASVHRGERLASLQDRYRDLQRAHLDAEGKEAALLAGLATRPDTGQRELDRRLKRVQSGRRERKMDMDMIKLQAGDVVLGETTMVRRCSGTQTSEKGDAGRVALQAMEKDLGKALNEKNSLMRKLQLSLQLFYPLRKELFASKEEIVKLRNLFQSETFKAREAVLMSPRREQSKLTEAVLRHNEVVAEYRQQITTLKAKLTMSSDSAAERQSKLLTQLGAAEAHIQKVRDEYSKLRAVYRTNQGVLAKTRTAVEETKCKLAQEEETRKMCQEELNSVQSYKERLENVTAELAREKTVLNKKLHRTKSAQGSTLRAYRSAVYKCREAERPLKHGLPVCQERLSALSAANVRMKELAAAQFADFRRIFSLVQSKLVTAVENASVQQRDAMNRALRKWKLAEDSHSEATLSLQSENQALVHSQEKLAETLKKNKRKVASLKKSLKESPRTMKRAFSTGSVLSQQSPHSVSTLSNLRGICRGLRQDLAVIQLEQSSMNSTIQCLSSAWSANSSNLVNAQTAVARIGRIMLRRLAQLRASHSAMVANVQRDLHSHSRYIRTVQSSPPAESVELPLQPTMTLPPVTLSPALQAKHSASFSADADGDASFNPLTPWRKRRLRIFVPESVGDSEEVVRLDTGDSVDDWLAASPFRSQRETVATDRLSVISSLAGQDEVLEEFADAFAMFQATYLDAVSFSSWQEFAGLARAWTEYCGGTCRRSLTREEWLGITRSDPVHEWEGLFDVLDHRRCGHIGFADLLFMTALDEMDGGKYSEVLLRFLKRCVWCRRSGEDPPQRPADLPSCSVDDLDDDTTDESGSDCEGSI